MARIRVPLNNFTFGEVSPSITSRTDAQIYNQSAETVTNCLIREEGGLVRRPGTKFQYQWAQASNQPDTTKIRIEPFIFSDDEKYLMAFLATTSSCKVFALRVDNDTNDLVDSDGNLLGLYGGGSTSYSSFYEAVSYSSATGSVVPPVRQSNLFQFSVAQRGDFMFITHRDFFPFVIKRTSLTAFTTEEYTFDTNIDGSKRFQPYYNFQDAGVTIASNATAAGTATLTASADYFVSGHVGTRLLIGETEAYITAVGSATSATATLKSALEFQLAIDSLKTTLDSDKVQVTQIAHGYASGGSVTFSKAGGLGGISSSNINGARTISAIIDENTYEITAGGTATSTAIGGGTPIITSGAATTEWYEQSYSDLRGFPQAICFHEDRLWFAGTPSQPDALWGSKSGEYFNFDLGTGADNDSIEIDANTGVTNEIRHLVSNRDLQVFASQGEFIIPTFDNQPLKPTNVKIVQQTPFGTGFVRPVPLEGPTLFVQGTGTGVREFVFTDNENAYTGSLVSLLSEHLISNPVDIAVITGGLDRSTGYAFFVMDNGEIAVYYSLRGEKRSGWTRWVTNQGSGRSTDKFISVTAIGNNLFALTQRNTGANSYTRFYIERFDKDALMDCESLTDNSGIGDDVAGQFGTGGPSYSYSSFWNKSTPFLGGDLAIVDHNNNDYFGEITSAALSSGTGFSIKDIKALTSAKIGIFFKVIIKTLPIDAQVMGGPLTGEPRKITKVIVDLNETLSLSVNDTDMILRQVNDNITSSFIDARTAVTGKKEFFVLGFSRDPRVTISQTAPFKLQLNGMVVEVAF